jgi:P pilus assembly chaperone PapD
MRTTVKRAVVIGTALAVTTGAGVAYAAWVANGTGSAAVTATTAQSLSATTVSPSVALYPGATADAVIQITNPNSFPVHVATITANGAITGSGGTGTCTTTGVTLTLPASVSVDVSANSTKSITLTGAFAMSNASDTGCQGATFTAPISISGASAAS